ncbi:hypothetical protein EDD86DRAFT_2503 [Gorgonomyces haynaldii]|nr:hypothetical protein EDD86DRAFT_2503 [Gorgonomyces haynaldii]
MSLPTELWLQIFENIDKLSDLWTIRQVSRRFLSLAQLTIQANLIKGPIKPMMHLGLKQSCFQHPGLYALEPTSIKEDTVYFTSNPQLIPAEMQQGGFRGFGSLLTTILERIAQDTSALPESEGSDVSTPFRRDDYVQVAEFMKQGWQSMAATIPVPLRSAYEALFGHTIRTYETMCRRPHFTMDVQLQQALLSQTWRVVHALAPPQGRDPHVCQESCCAGDFQLLLGLSTQDKVKDYEITLNDSTCTESIKLCQSQDGEALVLKKYNVELCNGAYLQAKCLFMGTSMSLTDLSLNCKRAWLCAR